MIIYVNVKPNSLKDTVEKLDDGSYVIHTKQKAIDGKANLAVVKMLAKEFGVSYKNIHIKNPTSRKKIVHVDILP